MKEADVTKYGSNKDTDSQM